MSNPSSFNKAVLAHKIRATGYNDEHLYFSDGSYLSFGHRQSCCEVNYADFSSLDNTGFFEGEFNAIELQVGDWGGFRINGFAVNCYSKQNGCYSSRLDIYYHDKDGKILCWIEQYGEII